LPILGVDPDDFLEEGKVIQVGKLQVAVIHTPGHSPGSVCLYLREQKILFSGDTLFQGTIGNLHLPTSQPEKMWESLRKLAALPPETHVVPGHGSDTVLAKETWLSHAKEIFSK
jgi:glyoxylase-like metal-dependent hydrolase (beta-lactamase superfamily II)